VNSGVAPSWYVVQTQIHAERKAAANLQRQGFDTYFPRFLKRRKLARRVEQVAAPLFPRYLFVSIDLTNQRWLAIQSTLGVSHLIRMGDAPAVVLPGVIEGFKQREDENGLIRLVRQPLFAPGDKVTVLEGPFQDCYGLYEGLRDGDRVAILLDLLGRKVRVSLEPELVAAG